MMTISHQQFFENLCLTLHWKRLRIELGNCLDWTQVLSKDPGDGGSIAVVYKSPKDRYGVVTPMGSPYRPPGDDFRIETITPNGTRALRKIDAVFINDIEGQR